MPAKMIDIRSDTPQTDTLAFEKPLPGATRLHLTLDAKRYGGSGAFRFVVPRSAWEPEPPSVAAAVPTARPQPPSNPAPRVVPPPSTPVVPVEPEPARPEPIAVTPAPAPSPPIATAFPKVPASNLPPEQRRILVDAMKAGYPKTLADATAEVKRAEAGAITSAVKKTFVPSVKTVPIQYPSVEAKEEYVRQARERLAELATDPSPAAPLIRGYVGPKTVGRIGRAFVVDVRDRDSVELLLLDTAGNPDRSRRTVADGVNTSQMVNGQMAVIPGVFYCPGSRDGGGVYALRPAILDPDDVKEIVGVRTAPPGFR